MTAGLEKIFHPDPRIGFLKQASVLADQAPKLVQAVDGAKLADDSATLRSAEKELRTNRVTRFNNLLDATVAAIFLVLVSCILVVSAREWMLLLAHRRQVVLKETEPVWLPEHAFVEGRPSRAAGMAALAFGLAKELSGEAQLERAQRDTIVCECVGSGATSVAAVQTHGHRAARYVEVTERRFNGFTRCC
jgi:hypothetical protein